VFKGVSQCIPTMDVLYYGQVNPFQYSPLPLYFPSTPIFHSFQYMTFILYLHILCNEILLMLYHSLPFHLSWGLLSSSIITNVLYMWVCLWSCLFLCICLSFDIFCIWKKTCSVFQLIDMRSTSGFYNCERISTCIVHVPVVLHVLQHPVECNRDPHWFLMLSLYVTMECVLENSPGKTLVPGIFFLRK
jgi:hypothetical protein